MTYTCAECGGVFESERSEAEARAEARAIWGVDSDGPGIAIVCDRCWREIVRREMGLVEPAR
jgi:hypothetical protein